MENNNTQSKVDGEKPDFNEWIKTEEGLKCCDMATLTSEEYLKNRLFWAFDAGRDCIWHQYLAFKRENESMKARIKELESSQSSPVETPPVRSAEAFLKEVAIKFFYWWYNTKGSNTEQGFDDWIQEDGKKYIDQLSQFKPSVVGEKEEQRKLLIEIMKEDEKHGMYEASERFTIEDMEECWQASRDHHFYQCDPAQKKYYPNFDEWIKTRKK